MIFDGKYTGTGFDHVPGGDIYANRSALSFHYYCNSFVPNYGAKPTMTKVVCDDIVKKLVFSSIPKELAKIGGSAVMTEGMACDTSTPEKEVECQEVMTSLDEHLFSWTDYGVSQGAKWAPTLYVITRSSSLLFTREIKAQLGDLDLPCLCYLCWLLFL